MTDAMDAAGDRSRDQADEELRDDELALIARTSIDWEALRPQVGDDAQYEQLMAVVRDATENNMAIAQLKQRIVDLGAAGVALAKKIATLV